MANTPVLSSKVTGVDAVERLRSLAAMQARAARLLSSRQLSGVEASADPDINTPRAKSDV
jgi:hypothetical protein